MPSVQNGILPGKEPSIPDESSLNVGRGMSRREFLLATGAATLVLWLDSCTPGLSSPSASSVSIPPGSSPYEQALKLLHQAVLASPDHLAQRAADVVATKDATKIVEFVRDRIGVIPITYGAGDPSLSRRWGASATLRGGLGTLRDRADVLADLLTKAGFKAEVQVADRPAGITVQTLYQARPAPTFAPTKALVDAALGLLHQAGLPAPAKQQAFQAGPDPAAAIFASLPASVQTAQTRNELLPQSVPLVVFQEGGKTRYAFAIGDIAIVDTPPARVGPRSEDQVPNVSFTVSAVFNPGLGGTTPRGQLIDLVSASWPADQVFGHQVLLTFMPIQGPKAVLDSGLANLPVRVPVLRLQNSSVPAADAAKLSVPGSPITIHGDFLGSTTSGQSGGMPGPFGTIQVLSDSDRTAALLRAKAIRATASAASFPDVEVEFAVSDASGASIPGLDARSFSVKDQGKAVDSFALYSNSNDQPRPRILVVYEGLYDSATAPYKTDADKLAIETALAAAIVTQAGKTPFDVQVVSPGASPDPGAWAPPDQGKLGVIFNRLYSDADDPWRSIAGASLDQRISAAIMVGDVDVSDPNSTSTAFYRRRLIASGVPVFVVPTGNVKTANVDDIVGASAGAQLNVGDPGTPAKLAGLLGGVASKWVGGGYRLRYQAPAAGPTTRTVTIGLARQPQPVATADYQVPAQPIPPPSVVGLYLTIRSGPQSAQRRIAGLMYSGGSIQGLPDDPAAAAEARAALDGVTTVAVEPGTPTQAALLDDLVTSYLSAAPLVKLGTGSTSDQVLNAIRGGIKRTPVLLPPLLRPAAVDAASVPGLRVAIFQERAPTTSTVEVHCDLAVGLNELVPLASDQHAAFKSAVTTSVAWSAAEAATVADSAYGRLSNVKLTGLARDDPGGLNNWLKTVPPEKLAAWTAITHVYTDYHLVVPVAGGADALWVVDPATGVSKAVMLDSTGGGILAGNCHLDGFDYEALAIAELAMACSIVSSDFPIFCAGINTAASGMCVIAIFNGHADLGTPFGAIQPWLGLGEAGMQGLDFSIGFALILLTLSSAGCI
ncbi:MAG TPA: hypothetical protein VND96_13335 [Candidatus Micrarchaeaceae archaeon]|nr:hypothetical protein [Candidatus Micrarchaeaceae archaeon]